MTRNHLCSLQHLLMADDKSVRSMTKTTDNESKPQNNLIEEEEPMDEDGGDNFNEDEDLSSSDEEFEKLNNQLDELNSALDILEEKNDNIHAQLMELLVSNREVREQFKANQEDVPQQNSPDSL